MCDERALATSDSEVTSSALIQRLIAVFSSSFLLSLSLSLFPKKAPKPPKTNPFTQEGVLVGLLFGAILGVAGLIGLVWCRIQYRRWKYEAVQG